MGPKIVHRFRGLKDTKFQIGIILFRVEKNIRESVIFPGMTRDVVVQYPASMIQALLLIVSDERYDR